jgi:uncharacterized membrane protein
MQSKYMSLLEATVGQIIGFLIGWVTNYLVLPLFGLAVSLSKSFWLTVVFAVVSFIRSYAIRRLFNWLHVRGWR